MTFASGAAGAGVTTDFAYTSSWLTPVSMTSGAPATMIGVPLFTMLALSRMSVVPCGAAFARAVLTVGGALGTAVIVAVSWVGPAGPMRMVWPTRKPNGFDSRRPVASTAVAPLSVVDSALFAYWVSTASRSANE